jgi:hypothetical protein
MKFLPRVCGPSLLIVREKERKKSTEKIKNKAKKKPGRKVRGKFLAEYPCKRHTSQLACYISQL